MRAIRGPGRRLIHWKGPVSKRGNHQNHSPDDNLGCSLHIQVARQEEGAFASWQCRSAHLSGASSRVPTPIRATNQASFKQVVKSRLNLVDIISSEAGHLSGCDRSPSAKNTKDDAIHVIGFLLVPEGRDLHHDGQFPNFTITPPSRQSYPSLLYPIAPRIGWIPVWCVEFHLRLLSFRCMSQPEQFWDRALSVGDVQNRTATYTYQRGCL